MLRDTAADNIAALACASGQGRAVQLQELIASAEQHARRFDAEGAFARLMLPSWRAELESAELREQIARVERALDRAKAARHA